MAAAATRDDDQGVERWEVSARIARVGVGYVPPEKRPDDYLEARLRTGDWRVTPPLRTDADG